MSLTIVQLTPEELRTVVREAIEEALRLQEASSLSEEKSEALMDTFEAANFLKISTHTIYAKTRRNAIPFMKQNNRLYFERAKLLEWLRASEQVSEEDQRAEAVARFRAMRKGAKK